MGRRRRTGVEKYHDRVAGRYDHSYDDAYWQWHDQITWEHLKGFLPADLTAPVLDLGCGTGKWGAKLLKSGYRVTFVDISHQMLDQARDKAEEQNALDRAAFVRADIAALAELPREHFALATAFGEPIACTASPAQTLREIRRVLTPDGVLVATLDNRLNALDFYLEKGDLEALSRFLRDGRTHWLTRDQDEQFPIVTTAPGDLRKLVELSGFDLLDVIGKTVLPMRRFRHLLAESADRRRFAKIESSLHRDPAAIGRAAHLQFAARVRL